MRGRSASFALLAVAAAAAAVACVLLAASGGAALKVPSSRGPVYPGSGAPIAARLTAPWTPFHSTPPYALCISCLPQYIDALASQGANVMFLGGGMGQFDSMTTAERMQLATAAVPLGQQKGFYVIVHVGTTVQQDAMRMAAHARAVGADAIAAVPPYYEHAGGEQGIADWFAPIVNASADAATGAALPFFYYNIPGSSHVQVSLATFIPAMLAAIPSFAGIKYVVSGNAGEYMDAQKKFGDRLALWFAPEPKLRSFTMGARGFVLAESFYAPTLLRMCQHFVQQNMSAAFAEQEWKSKIDQIFGNFGGTVAKRAVYRKLGGVDIGPERPPGNTVPLGQATYDQLIAALTAAGFFSQTWPADCLLPKIW